MLQAVFDGISDPLILVDKECRVKIINNVAADYYGVDRSRDILEKYCYHVFRGRLEPCEGCQVPKAVLDGRSLTFERPGFINADRLEQVVIYPVKEKTGAIGDAIIRLTDITESKKIERQLIHSEKMASLGVLVTSIAHEINNPINFITFNVPILRDYIQAMITITDGYAAAHSEFELCNMDYPEFRSDIYKLLDNIDHGSGRISTFVSNLKEFSQDSEKKPHRWVDLNQVVERTISICHNKIKKTVKSFVKNISEHLSQVYTDPYALEQVLINLLVNATQASNKKDSWVKLNVSGRKGHVIIEISDNGCGMDEETRLKIFDPFFTTKSPAEGTGLGLYVCHNLIRDLRGLIEVESEPGVGSTFKVMLPDAERKHENRAGVINPAIKKSKE
jgi:signal transduction histidine kinase